ncbi:uncharacterized protein BDR25DRAFT_359700 [Lindgomyces ingoldianus]|uniref:Uncharacterized protein n=1 Tax=Lindgomyces ingoldianus TaxID=673940 RepID=A0ACB6QJN0_9PLEO|nr:uncharacterized protein BDR25DRAFT_359700 [Lindgomyces ingoldianus]KAF2466341.1 hypothetical protein BDR25DRAFT_359700 [Lindgomyces ingoldianus]
MNTTPYRPSFFPQRHHATVPSKASSHRCLSWISSLEQTIAHNSCLTTMPSKPFSIPISFAKGPRGLLQARNLIEVNLHDVDRKLPERDVMPASSVYPTPLCTYPLNIVAAIVPQITPHHTFGSANSMGSPFTQCLPSYKLTTGDYAGTTFATSDDISKSKNTSNSDELDVKMMDAATSFIGEEQLESTTHFHGPKAAYYEAQITIEAYYGTLPKGDNGTTHAVSATISLFETTIRFGEPSWCGLNCKKFYIDKASFKCEECGTEVMKLLENKLSEQNKEKLSSARTIKNTAFVATYMTEFIPKYTTFASITETAMSFIGTSYGRPKGCSASCLKGNQIKTKQFAERESTHRNEGLIKGLKYSAELEELNKLLERKKILEKPPSLVKMQWASLLVKVEDEKEDESSVFQKTRGFERFVNLIWLSPIFYACGYIREVLADTFLNLNTQKPTKCQLDFDNIQAANLKCYIPVLGTPLLGIRASACSNTRSSAHQLILPLISPKAEPKTKNPPRGVKPFGTIRLMNRRGLGVKIDFWPNGFPLLHRQLPLGGFKAIVLVGGSLNMLLGGITTPIVAETVNGIVNLLHNRINLDTQYLITCPIAFRILIGDLKYSIGGKPDADFG